MDVDAQAVLALYRQKCAELQEQVFILTAAQQATQTRADELQRQIDTKEPA